jgi:hypothetical protein
VSPSSAILSDNLRGVFLVAMGKDKAPKPN